MKRIVKSGRLAVMAALLTAFLGLYATGLYRLQIVEGAAYHELSQNSIMSTVKITAARGNILDRYGRLLVSNRVCNNLTVNTKQLFGGDSPGDSDIARANETILKVVALIAECGDSYNDTLPITMSPPFEYTEKINSLQRTILDAYIKDHANKSNGLSADTSALELMAYFRDRYKIDPKYDAMQTRIIAGVRYEINSRYSADTAEYIFAQDVGNELITRLLESGVRGFDVQQSYIRGYNTEFAAHVIGYLGGMEYDDFFGPNGEGGGYKDKGYQYDALVGKEGAELAFEQYLHGTDGIALVQRTSAGTIVKTTYQETPQPGNNVYLTIDIGLQEAAELALSSGIEKMQAERDILNDENIANGRLDKVLQPISGGALVAIDVKTGEPLCIASNPTFSLSTFYDNAEALYEDKTSPLFNRALLGEYPPGSTFKPITALTILSTGTAEVYTEIHDDVTYMRYDYLQYTPSCWIKGAGNHGMVNVIRAIEVSCNYYFFYFSDKLTTDKEHQGIDKIDAVAEKFGLGSSTGIELPENIGMLASQENKKKEYPDSELDQGWYAADNLSAAIGQSINRFTPLQLANYTATLANGGTLYNVSALKAVRSYDYSEKIYEHTPVIKDLAVFDQSYYDAVKQGMERLVSSGENRTVYDVFSTVPYHVAAKTGTAQMGESLTNNGIFICYAPYENPEIAVAVVVEKGNAGSNLAEIARSVLDYYFTFKNNSAALEGENTLLK